MNKQVTLSFAHGRGNLDHNARRKNGNPRTWGIRERQVWNETIIERDVDEVLENNLGHALRAYNAKQLTGKHPHPERVKTMQEWVRAQRRGRPAYTEFVFQLGNKLTACPYDYVTKNGQMIAMDGSVIMPWQTKKTPMPRVLDGKLYPSDEQKELKKVYRSMFERFCELNQYMIPVGAYVHCDEFGGTHLHLDIICMSEKMSKKKNSIGWSLGVTACEAQMLDKMGIKYGKTRNDNAQKVWTRLMREEMTRVANEHGYEIIDGRCRGRKKEDTPVYIEQENARNDYLDGVWNDLQAKERSLNERERAVNVRMSNLDAREAQIKRAERDLDAREAGFQNKLRDLERREQRVNTLKNVADTTMETAKRIREDADRCWKEANDAILECDKWKEKYREAENELAAAKKQLAAREKVIGQIQTAHPEWFKNIVIERGIGHGRKM